MTKFLFQQMFQGADIRYDEKRESLLLAAATGWVFWALYGGEMGIYGIIRGINALN